MYKNNNVVDNNKNNKDLKVFNNIDKKPLRYSTDLRNALKTLIEINEKGTILEDIDKYF